MPRHAMHIPELSPLVDRVTLAGDEARHALRVKRVNMGDTVLVLDGRGSVAEALVVGVGRELTIEIQSRSSEKILTPAVEVWSATPKGTRLGALIDHLSEVGAESWTPMRTERAGVDPSAARRDRLERVAVEAMKQCRRPWLLRLEAPASFDDGIGPSPGDAEGVEIVIADAAGEPYRATGAARVRLLVGPEGGFSPSELASALVAGARVCRFGPHVMRIEVAAAVACAIVRDHERPPPRAGA